MAEDVDREKLYSEVWTTPLTALCKSYGLSYACMRRLYSELWTSQFRKRGHWARVGAGQAFIKPALPIGPRRSYALSTTWQGRS